jgi:hypothetical protein
MLPRRETADHAGVGAAQNPSRTGEIDVRNVFRDGNLVAVLMALDQGDSFTVVTEVFAQDASGGGESVTRRPYTFPDASAGLSFLNEAVTSFTYLGCEVRKQ